MNKSLSLAVLSHLHPIRFSLPPPNVCVCVRVCVVVMGRIVVTEELVAYFDFSFVLRKVRAPSELASLSSTRLLTKEKVGNLHITSKLLLL